MNPTQQTIAMLFGVALAIVGVVLFARKPSESETRVKVFGVELTVKTPSIVILVLGCVVFLAPFVPPFRPDQPPEPAESPSGNSAATQAPTPTGSEAVLPSPQEPPPAGPELGGTPVDSTVANDGSVWVVLRQSGSLPALVRLNQSTLQPNPAGQVTGVPVRVIAEPNTDTVWVLTSREGAKPFDPRVSQFGSPILLGGEPSRARFALGSLWISIPSKNKVVRVNVDTTEYVAIHVGNDPRFLVFVSQMMWVANGDSTVSPIRPDNVTSPPLQLPAPPVAMIIFGGQPLVATSDGSVMKIDSAGVLSPATQVSQGDTRLTPTNTHVWAWQEGDDTVWRIDSAGAPAEEYTLPFALEKLTEMGGVLWAVTTDGRIAELDADNASVTALWAAIQDRAWQFVRDEERNTLLLMAEDGTVYNLPT